jgi:hypothetical protein
MAFLFENYYIFNKFRSFVTNILMFVTYFLHFVFCLKYCLNFTCSLLHPQKSISIHCS